MYRDGQNDRESSSDGSALEAPEHEGYTTRAKNAIQNAGRTAISRMLGRPFQTGEASYYGTSTPAEKARGVGDGFATRKMANGQPMNPNAMIGAHKTLPLGTQVHVVDVATENAVDLTIEDRGPYEKGRILDGSPAVAEKLGYKEAGHGTVEIYKK